jgi:hypothetical protein
MQKKEEASIGPARHWRMRIRGIASSFLGSLMRHQCQGLAMALLRPFLI